MAFAYSIAQVLTHVGMVHGSAQKPAQRLVVASRSVRPAGDPMTDRNWYSCRAIVEGEKCQYVSNGLVDFVEEELQPYPT